MTVIVKYVVERNGEEKMTFTSKTDADAYDKMLDMADELFQLLVESDLIKDEAQLEEVSLYLAQNREDVLCALGAKRKTSPKAAKEDQEKENGKEESTQDDDIKAA